jgi:hypothetical protein
MRFKVVMALLLVVAITDIGVTLLTSAWGRMLAGGTTSSRGSKLVHRRSPASTVFPALVDGRRFPVGSRAPSNDPVLKLHPMKQAAN